MGSCFELLPLPATIMPAAPLSDDELIAFSRLTEPYRTELSAKGEIIVMTPTVGQGGAQEAYLIRILGNWAEEAGGGICFSSSAGFRLPDTSVLSPDACWVAIERWNALSDDQRRSFTPLCPDFVVELRSQSERVTDLEEKMDRWMANGARLALLIDPFRKLAKIYRPGQEPETLHKPEVLEGEGPVAGFRLEMRRFWA